VKVIIIDDEKAMHFIMKRMLAKHDEIEIVGCFQDTTSAFSFLMSNRVDLVFADINMSRENGLDFAKRLRKSGWQMKLVFVTSYKEYALPAFDVYAYDYIVKPISQERLQETLQRALSQEIIPELESIDIAYSKKIPPLIKPLTKREMEILQFISKGMSNREIATAFDLSEGTVKNHVVNIFSKLQVKNRVQATTAAKELKLNS